MTIDRFTFTYNTGLTSISLPTHANSGFVEYKDATNNTYNPGDNISDFFTSYEAVITVITYTVVFNDWDGTELLTDSIAHGSAATAPADPTREGYSFTGWDIDFSNVTSDLTVTAQYQLLHPNRRRRCSYQWRNRKLQLQFCN